MNQSWTRTGPELETEESIETRVHRDQSDCELSIAGTCISVFVFFFPDRPRTSQPETPTGLLSLVP